MRTIMGDWQLLQAYAKNRSEAAFAELVRRHLDWVYSVALRHVGDPHLAEDVVQSVFVLLARKARDLGPGTLVGGWLFRTTRLVAGHARRAEQRRKSREATACTMSHDTTSPDTDEILWQQLAPHLDQAVAALSEADRSAILLRFYEKMPLRQVGEKMGVSEEAAKKRVSRAVEKMREFLDRRGSQAERGRARGNLGRENGADGLGGAGRRGRQDFHGSGIRIGLNDVAAIGARDSPRLALGKAQAGCGTRGGFVGFDFRGGECRRLAHAPCGAAVSFRGWLPRAAEASAGCDRPRW